MFEMEIKEIKKNGFVINKRKDTFFYTFDYTYTSGMNSHIRNGSVLPELILVGTPVIYAQKIINEIAMMFFKIGAPSSNFIYEKFHSFPDLKVLIVKVDSLNLLKDDMNISFLINKTLKNEDISSIYQIIPSNEFGVFDFKDFTSKEDLPLFFKKDHISIEKIKKVNAVFVNPVEHRMILKSNKLFK